MKNKFSLFMLIFCGVILLTCASIVTVKYNSNYISYNYPNLLNFQKTGSVSDSDDPQNDNSVALKQKCARDDESENDLHADTTQQSLLGGLENITTKNSKKIRVDPVFGSQDFITLISADVAHCDADVGLAMLFSNQEINSVLMNDLSKLKKSLELQMTSQNIFDALYQKDTATGTTQIIGLDVIGEAELAALLLFACLVMFTLVSNKNEKIKLQNTKFLSIFFIVILLSSSTLTPFSMEQKYWGMAFAEPLNQTNNTLTNDTVPSVVNSTIGSIATNSTITGINETNSTQSHNDTTNYNMPSLASNIVVQNLTDSTVSSHISHDLYDTLSIYDNSTILQNHVSGPIHDNITISSDVGIVDNVATSYNGSMPTMQGASDLSADMSMFDSIRVTKIGIAIPNATKSWDFASDNGIEGKTEIQNNTLTLQGNGYIHENIGSSNVLKNFTISAWVKPDYSQGSSVFTIISKTNQFALDLNNNIPPVKDATFSVFDGVRWNTINSTVSIPKNSWTYLAGVYNGTSISLYVNGTLQSSYTLQGVLTVSDDGHLVLVNPDQISSRYDVVIGASVNPTRSSVMDKFSGDIRNVNFYKQILGPEQILKIYLQNTQTANHYNSSLGEDMSVTDSILVSLNSTNNTGINSMRVVPTIQKTKSSYSIGENPEFVFKVFKDSDLKKIRSEIRHVVQQNSWSDKNSTISVKVLSPNGTQIPINAQFAKLKEGQFDIKIPSKRFGKPGMYTIQATLVKNGKTYTTQEQYAWGLVSVNTDKSIYRPGQAANMTIVVLDSQGSPVCNAQVSMNVISPNSGSTALSSGNGITSGSECGLYYTKYATTLEGNYTVNVSAKENSINTNFSTSFLVQNNFAFDIIRTAQSKIDPKSNPNLFGVKIDVTSFTNATSVMIQESVPAVFDVKTDGTVKTMGDTKLISWNKNLVSNKTSVQYLYSVPMVFPQLYALGPAKITYGNNTFTESRQWFVANDPPAGTIQFDGVPTSQGYSTTATNNEKNMSITIGNNSNRLLLVQAAVNSASPAMTVFWKGIQLTPIGTGNSNSSKTIEFFYLVNPPTGTDNVVVDTTTNTKGVVGVYSLYGVDQSTPVIKSGTNTKGSNTIPSIILTNSQANSLLIDLAENPAAIFDTSSCATCTIVWNNNGGASTIQAGSQWMRTTTAGSSTAFSWTLASSRAWIMTGVEVIPAGILGQNDTMIISDNINMAVNKTLSDSMSVDDQISASRLFTASDSDQVSISEQLSTLRTRSVSLSDSIAISDQSTALHFNEHYYDGLPVTVTSSPTSLASFTPSISAGDNLIIVSAQFDGSSTTSIATVSSGNLQLKKNGVTLTSNPFDINVEGDLQGTKQASTVLFYKDTGADANPTYDVTSLASQNISGEVKILVIHEAPYSSFGNSTVVALPTAKTTIFSHMPNFSSGNNLVLAEINLHNTAGSARTFAAGAVDIERSGTVLSSNQNGFTLDASTAVINSHSILLIANDTDAPANPAYDVTTNPSTTGVNGQVQIFVIQGLKYSFVDSANSALTTTDSTLGSASVETNSATDEIAVIAGVETKSGTTSLRTINPSSMKISTGGTTLSSNEFGIEMKSGGTQFRDHVLLDGSNNFGQNPTFDVIESQTSTNSVNAETKLVAINLNAKSVSLTDSMGITDSRSSTNGHLLLLSDNVMMSETLSKSSALTLSDSVSMIDAISKSTNMTLSDQVQILDSTETIRTGSNQFVVSNTTQTVTVPSQQTDLLVTSNNTALSTVTVPSTVSTATLNYSKIIKTNSSSVTVGIVNPLEITKDLDGNGVADVKVFLPANVTIQGNSLWTGVITLPTVTLSPTIPAVSGQTHTVTNTIKVGSSSISLSFDKAVRLVFVGNAGQNVGYFNSITSFTQITSVCSDNTQATNDGLASGGDCKINVGSDLVVWTKHFTDFSTFTSTSTSGATSSSISGNAGGGGVGAATSGVGASSSSSNGGAGPYLKIQYISYDVCDKQLVRIQVGTDVNSTNPMVIVRTSLTGVIDAKLVQDQPFAQENINATVRKLVYEAYISPKEKSFEVVALESVGHNVFSVGKTIDVTDCKANFDYSHIGLMVTSGIVDTSVPKIFDVKFQINNGTKISSSEDDHFIDSQQLLVSAIVDSVSSLDNAELRFETSGDNTTNYQTISMAITPLQISNTTYILSGVIPKEMLKSPDVSYWVNVKNSVGKTSESDRYTIGVKPTYGINGKLEFDLKHQSRAEGSTATPTAYFTNYSDGPLYGTISLIVDGTTVYTSPVQEFGANQTAVPLEWKTKTLGDMATHQLYTVAQFYGKSIISDTQQVNTFHATQTAPISASQINIDVLKDKDGNVIATPQILYASYMHTGSENFKVIAPDGTCVIGLVNCLVTNSTSGVTQYHAISIGDQNYRVRYFEDSTLERFAISSVDPIIGRWYVEIDSNGTPQHDSVTDNVLLEIKYSGAK